MPEPSKITSTRKPRANLPIQDAKTLAQILQRNNVKARMERKLFDDFKAGSREQDIRNRMALIDRFFEEIGRAVTGFGNE